MSINSQWEKRVRLDDVMIRRRRNDERQSIRRKKGGEGMRDTVNAKGEREREFHY